MGKWTAALITLIIALGVRNVAHGGVTFSPTKGPTGASGKTGASGTNGSGGTTGASGNTGPTGTYTATATTNAAVSELWDDFLGDISGSSAGSAGNAGFTPTKGAGAGALNSQIAANASAGHPGIITLNAGTAGGSTNNASLRQGLAAFILGGGVLTWEAMFRIPVLSTAAEQFDFTVGMMSAAAGVDPANGVYFRYAPLDTFRFSCTTIVSNTTVTIGAVVGTDVMDLNSIQVGMAVSGTNMPPATTVSTVNYGGSTMVLSQAPSGSGTNNITFTVGDYLMAKTAVGSTRTRQVLSSKPVAGTFMSVGATTNAAGTSTDFVVNRTAATTIATNHPTTAIFPSFSLVKTTSSGASTSVLDADYWYHKLTLTTPR